MPEKLFFELGTDKQKKIISVGITEFGTYGFSNSSTNRIVQNAGISKGSLFKYFTNKEDFFFFILDAVTAELSEDLDKAAANFSKELFQRVIDYSTAEFSWYIHNPEKYRLIMMAFSQNDVEIYPKVMARYRNQEQDIYYRLLEDINTDHFRWERKMTIDILKWFLKGFNEDFIRGTNMEQHDLEHIKSDYVKSLLTHMEVLKNGLLK
ncbi:MAG: TetR/AcrR family transcriptional regulator [Lachnospiraceae bacterium]|nr:TetR/AcrR family transcriptional regulator [Lachnospiraceae bacterium]